MCSQSALQSLLSVILKNVTEMGRDMTSDKQADANRRNARKSTGPKTPEGKAVARLNAV